MQSSVGTSYNVQQASYKVAELITEVIKPYTIAKTILMPACTEMVKTVLDSKAAIKFSKFLYQLTLLSVAALVTCQVTSK
jgi:hypothetical protein